MTSKSRLLVLCTLMLCAFATAFSLEISRTQAQTQSGECIIPTPEEPALEIDFAHAHRLPQDAANEYFSKRVSCIEMAIEEADEKVPSVKVIGGKPVPSALFHDVVKIEFDTGNGIRSTCSGVIIANDTVLTAGHCACGSAYQASVIYAVEGKILSGGPGQDGFFIENLNLTSDPVLFPGYRCGLRIAQPGRDLALLRISPLQRFEDQKLSGVRFGPVLEAKGNKSRELPFALPFIRSTFSVLKRKNQLRNLFLAGFGLDETGELQDKPLGVFINIVSRNCVRGRVFRSRCAPFREFVLGTLRRQRGETPADSCGGDSGGPVYRIGTANILPELSSINGVTLPEKTLVGIVSRALQGVRQEYQGFCGGGGVYTAVGTYQVLAWLKENSVEFCYQSNIIGKECEEWQVEQQ